MLTDITEAALESCIERFLTGDVSPPASIKGLKKIPSPIKQAKVRLSSQYLLRTLRKLWNQ